MNLEPPHLGGDLPAQGYGATGAWVAPLWVNGAIPVLRHGVTGFLEQTWRSDPTQQGSSDVRNTRAHACVCSGPHTPGSLLVHSGVRENGRGSKGPVSKLQRPLSLALAGEQGSLTRIGAGGQTPSEPSNSTVGFQDSGGPGASCSPSRSDGVLSDTAT